LEINGHKKNDANRKQVGQQIELQNLLILSQSNLSIKKAFI